MAQDFEGKGFPVSTTDVQLRFADSDDAIVGIRLANILTSQVTADVYLQHNGSNIYLVKGAPHSCGWCSGIDRCGLQSCNDEWR